VFYYNTVRFTLYLLLISGGAGVLCAQTTDSPLFALPYSPSLDISSMDRSVDPCTDFYHYTCGAWIKKNPIPPDQARWDVYAKLSEENERFLWGILLEASKPNASRSLVETEIGDYFAACMDDQGQQTAGLTPLKTGLDAIAALGSIRDLPAYLGRQHLSMAGGGMLFGFGSNQDFEDSNRVIAFADAGGLGLPDRDYYTKTDPKSLEILEKYREHVGKMFELLGEAPPVAKTHAQTVLVIETELAKASLTQVDKRDPYKLFHKMTPAQLQALTPAFRWEAYFKASEVPDTSVINVTEPAYFTEVEKLLKAHKLDDWKTYLRWHLVHAKAALLPAAFDNANFDFYSKYLRGLEQMPPRWKRCVRRVDGEIGEALGQVFVAKTFAPSTKQSALSMTKAIEASMQSEIAQLPWMGEETKKRAVEKLHGIVNKIGYPDKWRDYSSIKIARDDYFGNVERATVFESRRELAKIGKPVDRTEWDITPPTVDAYYNPQMNDINFPAGVLQPPLFDPKMDDAPNYGNTGATIGHELTHGFDDEGRQFDAKGDLKDWWTKNDADQFETRANCVVEQYSGYTVIDDIKVNGKLTLGENLADVGGTWLAYLAWKSVTKGQDLQPIDGFTPDQRFFIGVAQWACGDERPESRRANAVTNPHSPDEYRINGVVSDIPEFGKAFACRVGQPMMRSQPCHVW
jgi:putative endopeptidase